MDHVRKYWKYHLAFWLGKVILNISELYYNFSDVKVYDMILLELVSLGCSIVFVYTNLFCYIKIKNRKKQFFIFILNVLAYLIVQPYMINLVTEVTTLYFVKLVSYIFINIVFFSIYFILENLETNNKYQKLIIENRENTLAVLTNQINPHFLMNTFNNLYATIALKDQESGDIILKLSNLLRYSFQVNRKPLVTIGEELEYIKNYISLEELRLDKLSINFNEQIPNKEIQIAPMLLITLLENAFKHGISEVTHSAWLNIDLVVQNKTLFILIENSKPTIKTNTLISGSGLKNLEKRLSLQYPERHNLYIEDDNVSFKVTLQIEL